MATPASQSPEPSGGVRFARTGLSASFIERVPVRIDARASVEKLRATSLAQEDEGDLFTLVARQVRPAAAIRALLLLSLRRSRRFRVRPRTIARFRAGVLGTDVFFRGGNSTGDSSG
jgi:hypothetical protein